MDRQEMVQWLRCNHEADLEALRKRADAIRSEQVGDEVHLRGLVELSNICARDCLYCGIRSGNTSVTRYRMTREEVVSCARQAVEFGFGTLVLQAGEDPGLTGAVVADLINAVKQETDLAITLSLGERDSEDLTAWRQAGADRYLLRFETSNRELFRYIHPPRPGQPERDRIEHLALLRSLGYEVGSGVMIGIPGQSYEDLARDIELFRGLGLDMIGVGPYIPHQDTPLGKSGGERLLGEEQQVPNTLAMGLKVVALTRISCPQVNIPSTTALATLDRQTGREQGLNWGANIIMPNLTPVQYRRMYEIYPSKAASTETAEQSRDTALRQIVGLGRVPGRGRGDSKHFQTLSSLKNN